MIAISQRLICAHREYLRTTINLDKDVGRRVLANHYLPGNPGADGLSWLAVIGHLKDSLWSIDLFRVESILLRGHWVMLGMDLFTRRIIGFGVKPRKYRWHE